MTEINLPTANEWTNLSAQLDARGFAIAKGLLPEHVCASLKNGYSDGATAYRSTISMARYGFGSGEYKYFARPLPAIVQSLRDHLYPPLAAIANSWNARLGIETQWPSDLSSLLNLCHAQGQTRPTPLILKYMAGDYNCLHQDLYGEIHFPLQVIICLSDMDTEFTGGELVLVEQRPRQQSRPMVLTLRQGDAAIIPVRDRPVRSRRGWARVQMRHGISEVTSGERFALGVIFHDAR